MWSAADDDGDLAAERVRVGDLFGDFMDEDGVDAEAGAGRKGFSGDFQEDSLVHVWLVSHEG